MKLFFLDIETNSDSLKFDKDTHEIIQIWIYNSKSWDKFSININIWKPLAENIKRLTWISDQEIRNWVGLQRALDWALNFLWKPEDAIIVWHNLENFDLYVLTKYDSRFKDYKYLDTLHLFLFLYPWLKSYTVQDLYKKFIRSEYLEKHQALQDSIDECELFNTLINKEYLEKYYRSKWKKLWFIKDIISKYDWWLNKKCYNLEYINQILEDVTNEGSTWYKSKLLEKWFFNYSKVNTDAEKYDIIKSPSPTNIISTEEMNSEYDKFLASTNNSKRGAQLSMMQHIKDVFNWDNKNLFIEAWTGTWKTYGYLLPAVSYVRKNNVSKKLKIFLATYTKVLQEQLMEKDIPLLKSLYPDVNFQLLKADSESISLDLVPFKWPLSFWDLLLWNWLYWWYFHLSDIHYSIQLNIWSDRLTSYNSTLPTVNNYDWKYWFRWKMERQLRDWNIFIVNQAFMISKLNPLSRNPYTELVTTKIAPHIRINEIYYTKLIIDEWHNLESVIREYLTLDYTKLKFDYIMNIFSKSSKFNILSYIEKQIDNILKSLLSATFQDIA